VVRNVRQVGIPSGRTPLMSERKALRFRELDVVRDQGFKDERVI
jgi:hypothetical protein